MNNNQTYWCTDELENYKSFQNSSISLHWHRMRFLENKTLIYW